MPSNKELEIQVKELSANLDKVVDSTNEALADMRGQMDELGTTLNQGFAEITKAINNPVMTTQTFEPMEQDMGNTGVVTDRINDQGDVELITTGQDYDDPFFQDKMTALAFDREMLTVYIQETNEKDADQVFEIAVNNKKEFFRRGETKTVMRMFVERLARAKPVHFDNIEYTNNQGVQAVKNPSRRGLRYPFTIISDPNPKGPAWLKSILAQP